MINQVEDEIHFVISCLKHSALRSVLFQVACKHVEGFTGLSETDKFTILLSSQNEEVVFALARSLHLGREVN